MPKRIANGEWRKVEYPGRTNIGAWQLGGARGLRLFENVRATEAEMLASPYFPWGEMDRFSFCVVGSYSGALPGCDTLENAQLHAAYAYEHSENGGQKPLPYQHNPRSLKVGRRYRLLVGSKGVAGVFWVGTVITKDDDTVTLHDAHQWVSATGRDGVRTDHENAAVPLALVLYSSEMR